jgi:hypothetical protein
MPSYKVLRSVAHNVAHSYLSLMNYRAGGYVVEHLHSTAHRAGEPRVEIDVKRGTIEPQPFRTPVLLESVADLQRWFGPLVHSQGAALDMVASARITIVFDLDQTFRSPTTGHELELYRCESMIVDDRGKHHVADVPEWWRT